MRREACCCSVQEVLWRTGTSLNISWQKSVMDGVKRLSSLSVPRSWFVFIKYPSSSFCFSLHPLSSPCLGNGSWRETKGGGHLASQTNRLHAKSNCYLPFSSSISSPSHLLHWIAYLTTATRRYHNDTYTIGFLSTCVRRCRPVLAHVTVRAFIINTADSGGGVGGGAGGVMSKRLMLQKAREGREKKHGKAERTTRTFWQSVMWKLFNVKLIEGIIIQLCSSSQPLRTFEHV